MTTRDGAICLATLSAFVGLAWLLPRRLGCIGAVLAHLAVSLVVFLLIIYDIVRGAVTDPDFIWMMGNFCWTALANLIVLPITLIATKRHKAARRPVLET